MDFTPSDIAFTPAVKALQSNQGSRPKNDVEAGAKIWSQVISPDLSKFIAGLDMFYLGTSTAEAQPYIQYRGGWPGFLKVLDEKTLAFADFAGNRQFITAGNLSENDRVFLFLMDYATSRRVKIWGRARVVDDDPELLARLMDQSYKARPERAILIEVSTWDANCPQHIHKRLPREAVARLLEEQEAKILELEAEVADLKAST